MDVKITRRLKPGTIVLKLGLSLVAGACANSTPVEQADFFSVANWSRYEREIVEANQRTAMENDRFLDAMESLNKRRIALEELQEQERWLKVHLAKVDADIKASQIKLQEESSRDEASRRKYAQATELTKFLEEEISCYLATEHYTTDDARRAAAVHQAASDIGPKVSGPRLYAEPSVYVNVSKKLESIKRCTRATT